RVTGPSAQRVRDRSPGVMKRGSAVEIARDRGGLGGVERPAAIRVEDRDRAPAQRIRAAAGLAVAGGLERVLDRATQLLGGDRTVAVGIELAEEIRRLLRDGRAVAVRADQAVEPVTELGLADALAAVRVQQVAD